MPTTYNMHQIKNISDATAATVSKRFNSSISVVFWFQVIGGVLPPLILGPLLDNVNLNPQVFDCLSGMEITDQLGDLSLRDDKEFPELRKRTQIIRKANALN